MSSHLTGTSSGAKTADAVIVDRPARMLSIILIGDGTNAATAILYDNASAASGNVLAQIHVDAGLVYESFVLPCGVEANKGIYLDIGGTGATAIVHYSDL